MSTLRRALEILGVLWVLSLSVSAIDATCGITPFNYRNHSIIHYHQHKTGGITLNQVIFRYGSKQMHGNRPDLIKAIQAKRGTLFLTYVREPVSCTISRFFFWRGAGSKQVNISPEKNNKVSCQTMRSYMLDGASHNFMYEKMIVGQPMGHCATNQSHSVFKRPSNLRAGVSVKEVCPAGEEAFARQLDSLLWGLRNHVFVGITEKFDLSLFLFAKQVGYPDARYCPKNVVVGAPKVSQLSDADRELVANRNQLDTALWESSQRIFQKRFECANATWDVMGEYNKFLASNEAYQIEKKCTWSQVRAEGIKLSADQANPNWVRPSRCKKGSATKSRQIIESIRQRHTAGI